MKIYYFSIVVKLWTTTINEHLF